MVDSGRFSPPGRGKPNTRVTSRKVSGCREGGWAGVDFAEATKGEPEAIIESALADCHTNSGLISYRQTGKAKLRANSGHSVHHG